MASIGGQALEAATGAVDTRTACVLAGQSEAFCGCVQERLGSRITREHVDAITGVARDALSGEGMEAAARTAENIDPATRDALIQCATQTAIQGALGDGAAEN
ncbi:hypothetical protein [Vitreimonas sp.]|uniref:hypothetical protein n=1 Tax=Vitreimonas sp. TaxID=3069702 RepID=UPI002D764A38|nr:hypothetical protein [Vitreimonas sp.]